MVPDFCSQTQLSIPEINLTEIWSHLATLSLQSMALNASLTDRKASSPGRILREEGLGKCHSGIKEEKEG
jgi:hypothetical protein